DVRFVAHLDLPKSLEAYYQETGRAGRDGQASDAWMSYGLQNVVTLRQMVEASDADEAHKHLEHAKLNAMLGFAESASCRREELLGYFGEPYEGPCNNCDNCLSPPETWDATEVARKALSCVYRTGQCFGVTYLTDVLLGKDDKRIRSFGHDLCSTYGIGKELAAGQWQSVYRQLLSKGLLRLHEDGHGGLRLDDACRPLLRGEQSLFLRRDVKASKAERRAGRGSAASGGGLWEALRALRKSLAEEQGVPPYVIFHDSTLADLVDKKPRSVAELNGISGIGEAKRERYGSKIIDTIGRYEQRVAFGLNDTSDETLSLFRGGMPLEAIAAQRELSPTTVLGHLANAMEAGKLSLEQVIDLDPGARADIEAAIAEHSDGNGALKPVYEALEGRYDYGLLRCVRAAMRQN
ncbi:MAG: HRDC domain-containing protein, partial [Chromatiales bacterium]|nr:HRDC domain-containing protein [Chromatiales bacterium]